jgi:uracil-DNA glycosylase
MDRQQLMNELILQIRGELGHGITFWAEKDWNEAAGALVSGRPVRIPPDLKGTATVPTSAPASAESTDPAKKQQPTFGPPPKAIGRVKDWQAQLEKVAEEVRSCAKCELAETRTKPVVCSGSGKVPLVFVGEAPGANEDAQGEAFVGRAGKLLTQIIEAIGIDRQDVYITNVLKCRPPGNRNPSTSEIECCSPFLLRQLELLKPRVICTLGMFATQLLLESKAPMGQLRGRVLLYRGIPVVPTYHPAALLRNPGWKRKVWEDVQLLRKVLDEGPEAYTPKISMKEDQQKDQPHSGNLF